MEKQIDPIEENDLDNVANTQPPDNSQPENSQAKKKKMLALKHGVSMKESILVLCIGQSWPKLRKPLFQ